MSAEKQIDEMAADIYSLFSSRPMSRALASLLYRKNWRKQSEIAKEIFNEIDNVIYSDGCRSFIRINCYEELKKKYTGGE